MITFVIEDMVGNLIKKIEDFHSSNLFKYSEKREDVPEVSNKSFMDALSYGINIQSPVNGGMDFLIHFFNKYTLDALGCKLEDAQGRYYSEFSPIWEKLGFVDIWREVCRTEEPMKVKQLIYVEDVLVSACIYNFFYLNGKVYQTFTDATDLFVLDQCNKESIENSFLSVGIVQDNKWVYGNKVFCETNNVDKENVGEFPFDLNMIISSSTDKNELKNILVDILNRKRFFFSGDIKVNIKGKEIWLRQFITPTTYNNLSAIQIAALIITEEKNRENEILRLDKHLRTLQKLSKLTIGHLYDGKIHWSDEVYDIFEVPISEQIFDVDNFDNPYDHYKIFLKFLLKNDFLKLKHEIIKSKKENDYNEFNVTCKIRTGRGNIKTLFLHITILSRSPKLEGIGYIQDITEEVNREAELKNILYEYENLVSDLTEFKKELELNIKEKNLLLDEFNFGVKNNLNIIFNLLDLDIPVNSKDLNSIIDITKDRINLAAIVLEKGFISENLHEINFKDSLSYVINYLLKLYGSKISINADIEEIYFSNDKVILLGLILNECLKGIFNSISYKVLLIISLSVSDDGTITFLVRSDSLNFSDISDTNLTNAELIVLNNFVDQLGGNYSVFKDSGFVLKIQFRDE